MAYNQITTCCENSLKNNAEELSKDLQIKMIEDVTHF